MHVFVAFFAFLEADFIIFSQHTVLPIGGATKPGAEIAVQLDSKGEGIALLSAIDDRLNWISDKVNSSLFSLLSMSY